MTIAITGATGQVGRELAYVLQQAGVSNRLLVRDLEKKASSLCHPTSEMVLFDYHVPETHKNALHKVDRLFLVCASSIGEAEIRSFLKMAKKEGVRMVVLMSGIGADKDVVHFLARLKTLVQEIGIPYIALRANWFFQNFGSSFRAMICNDHTLTFPDGGQTISLVDARDIAEVAAHFLLNESDVRNRDFNITGPESLSHKEVAQLLTKYLPYPVTYKEISEEQAKKQLGWDGIWLHLFRDIRAGVTAPVYPTVEKLLGKPARKLEKYIRDNSSIWQ